MNRPFTLSAVLLGTLGVASLPLDAAVIGVPGDSSTIQGAISQSADGDVILVEPGTYPESLDFLGKAVVVRSSEGPAVTILDGTDSFRLVNFTTGETPDAVLEGFTLRNGAGGAEGGAIRCFLSSPTIRDCVFEDNFAEDGGALFIEVAQDRVRLEGCVFRNNIADSLGGAIFALDSDLLVDGCEFEANQGVAGFAIHMDAPTTVASFPLLELRSSTFRLHSVYPGSPVADFGLGTVTALFSDVDASSCLFEENDGNLFAGAAVVQAGIGTFFRCTFRSNTAERGAALMIDGSATGIIEYCVFEGNTATLSGAGVYGSFLGRPWPSWTTQPSTETMRQWGAPRSTRTTTARSPSRTASSGATSGRTRCCTTCRGREWSSTAT